MIRNHQCYSEKIITVSTCSLRDAVIYSNEHKQWLHWRHGLVCQPGLVPWMWERSNRSTIFHTLTHQIVYCLLTFCCKLKGNKCIFHHTDAMFNSFTKSGYYFCLSLFSCFCLLIRQKVFQLILNRTQNSILLMK